MAAGDKNYKVNVAVSVLPIEETTLADGTTVRQDIHSQIDKGMGAQFTIPGSNNAASVSFHGNVTIPLGGMRTIAQLTGKSGVFTAVFIKVLSGGPVVVTQNGDAHVRAYIDVGEFLFYRANGALVLQDQYIDDTYGIDVAHVDIMVVQ